MASSVDVPTAPAVAPNSSDEGVPTVYNRGILLCVCVAISQEWPSSLSTQQPVDLGREKLNGTCDYSSALTPNEQDSRLMHVTGAVRFYKT